MDWLTRIGQLEPHAIFSRGALPSQIESCEKSLRLSLPSSLKELLYQSNGVEGEYGLALVWPIDRIEQDNLSFRSNADYADLYMAFDSLLFFGDAGNGDQFAFPIHEGSVRRPDVFVWNHEDDSRTWAAPSLDLYLEWWLSGRLKL